MPASAQASLSGGRWSSGSRNESPVRYPPPYDDTSYIRDYAVDFDLTLFSKLPYIGTAMVVCFVSVVCDTAVGACRKRCKHWGGSGASRSQAACLEMDSPFLRCVEKDEHQR